MTGPPMEIRVGAEIQPTVTRRPPHVPVHWRQAVSEQLIRDVNLGVIERVPPNTPTTWLHNMVLTPKPDGTPRRTVDLQALNKYCQRETHHTIPPARQARAVPPNTIKTVTDAWNGYHSIEIRPADRHTTTFITAEGRFRYKRAPMGFVASQDAYTQRYDTIIADVVRKTKCVDDTLLWDDDVEQHWWRIIDYLALAGSNGVILNPGKFQFSSREVNFAGFQINNHEVRPLPKYLETIATFPRPKNITDIRAWFGLVNQVSHYGRTTSSMEPFKPLLSPRTPFHWDNTLETAFQQSKQDIIKEIENGVEIFDPTRPTCLNPDFSKTGIGYWLRQKHCDCTSALPGCCQNGWKITLAGSRFLRPAEQRYAPIEGEALAVAWALEDSKFFTLGCSKLLITTDHKPLVKILGNQSLDAITNPRLFRLKQRTLMWCYDIVHVPGVSIPAADATSRYPRNESARNNGSRTSNPSSALYEHDNMEQCVVASVRSVANSLGAVTWEHVKEHTATDTCLQDLIPFIENGFPTSRDLIPTHIQEYWQYRDELSSIDGAVVMGQRVVIPVTLQPKILQALHAAHQGTGKMLDRANASVFWPGMTKDIAATRAKCIECWRMAPTQPRLPPVEPSVPSMPFQAVAADFFSLRGADYLVIVDRFSGWPHIITSTLGAEATKKALVKYFATYGVPEELSTDGGPGFVAKDTTQLLKRWGVRHRLSSAHHPQSNGRAEVAVKSMKRLITSHTDHDGNIDTEAVAAGLLQYRNTPDADTGMSPSQIVFGTNRRDLLPVVSQTPVFSSSAVHPMWRAAWQQREIALKKRFAAQVDKLQQNTRPLANLQPGDFVRLQNQTGNHSRRWDRTGTVVEARPFHQYLVKVDGSGRLTLRNRQFLRKIREFQIDRSPPSPPMETLPWQQDSQPIPETHISTEEPPVRETCDDPAGPDGDGTTVPQPDSSSESEDVPTSNELPPGDLSPGDTPVRRSQRTRRTPAHLRDYVTF